MVSDILDNSADIISKITRSTGLSGAEINARIKQKQEEYGGLLTEAGAAYSIAKEMNVRIGDERQDTVKISELKEGMNNIQVIARVGSISPVREFERKGKQGKVANVFITDLSGSCRAVLWDKATDIVPDLNKNDAIRIKGYTRMNNGSVEIHTSFPENIEVVNDAQGLPEPKQTRVTLGDITKDTKSIDFSAKITKAFPVHEFQKEDRTGKVASLIVKDATAEKRLVLWDTQADKVNDFKEGDEIEVEDAYVKENNGELELHLGWRGKITKKVM